MDRHCADISIGGKYTIGYEPLTRKFKKDEEVVVAEFIHVKPPNCTCSEAKLLRFEGKGESRYHPIWIVDCHECPFYKRPLPHEYDRESIWLDVGGQLRGKEELK